MLSGCFRVSDVDIAGEVGFEQVQWRFEGVEKVQECVRDVAQVQGGFSHRLWSFGVGVGSVDAVIGCE